MYNFILKNLSGLVFCVLQLWINVVGLGDQVWGLLTTGEVGAMKLSFFLPCGLACLAYGLRTAKEKPDPLTFIPILPALLLYPILVRLIIYYN